MSPDEHVCDFCSGTPVKWAYPARDFVTATRHPRLDVGSEGGWAACDECHAIIARGDREELAKHSARSYVRTHGLSDFMTPGLAVEIRRMHDRFWSNREGAPQPVTGGTR